MNLTLHPKQQTVVDWAKSGTGSAFGEAVAGAGKTTTALMAVAEMDGFVSVMAYNKAAAIEFVTKARKLGLNFGNKVRFGTCHSFGLGGWRRAYPRVKVDEKLKTQKTIDAFRAAGAPKQLDSFVLKLVSLAKQQALGLFGDVNDRSEWYKIVDHHDLAYELEIDDSDDAPALCDPLPANGKPRYTATVESGIELAIRTLEYHVKLAPTLINFDDMIYMPIIFNIRLFECDWIVGDEWQDANAARRALVRKMLRRGGRALFIGDRHQAIYGFTGADNDSIDHTIREFNCIELPMTVSFRCPKAVVAEARKTVSHIEAHDNAPEGKVSTLTAAELLNKNYLTTLTATDAILCRKTKPLIDVAYALIRNGVACHVEGREIGQGLLKLVDRFARSKSLDKLRDKMDAWAEAECAKLIAKGRETQAENLMDRIETIKAIMDSVPPAATIQELRDRIAAMFVNADDQAKPTLTLSTVHKAKGREWPRVFILGRYDYMPSKWARQDWQQQQEQNLIYVAVTRAQQELIHIAEAENAAPN